MGEPLNDSVEPRDESMLDRRAQRRIVFVGIAVGIALLIWNFFDRYWYPSDGGIYAHLLTAGVW